jgi:hypothetical protein
MVGIQALAVLLESLPQYMCACLVPVSRVFGPPQPGPASQNPLLAAYQLNLLSCSFDRLASAMSGRGLARLLTLMTVHYAIMALLAYPRVTLGQSSTTPAVPAVTVSSQADRRMPCQPYIHPPVQSLVHPTSREQVNSASRLLLALAISVARHRPDRRYQLRSCRRRSFQADRSGHPERRADQGQSS